MLNVVKLLYFGLLCKFIYSQYTFLNEEKINEIGTLTGDVQNWATLIQNYILQVSFYRYAAIISSLFSRILYY